MQGALGQAQRAGAMRSAISARRPSRGVLRVHAAELIRPTLPVDPYQKMQDAMMAGTNVTGTIAGTNRRGVMVDLGTIKGFVPFSKLAPKRLRPGHQGNLDYLKGEPITARVVQVDVSGPRKELVLSERLACWAEDVRALGLAEGSEVAGVVSHLEDYGAFVTLTGADGQPSSVSGFVHLSELSWDRVLTPDQVVRTGQAVRARVLEVDVQKNRVALSMKQMQADPLRETLDNAHWVSSEEVLPELRPIVEAITQEAGVSQVAVGRRAEIPHTVAQDLELYLTREDLTPGSFTLVARCGRSLQELRVSSNLTRDAMKKAVTRVLSRLSRSTVAA